MSTRPISSIDFSEATHSLEQPANKVKNCALKTIANSTPVKGPLSANKTQDAPFRNTSTRDLPFKDILQRNKFALKAEEGRSNGIVEILSDWLDQGITLKAMSVEVLENFLHYTEDSTVIRAIVLTEIFKRFGLKLDAKAYLEREFNYLIDEQVTNCTLLRILLGGDPLEKFSGRKEKVHPLYYAISKDSQCMFSTFLKLELFKIDDSLLHFAAKYGATFIGEMLIEKGVDPNAVTIQKDTPLSLACENDHVSFALMLLSRAEIDLGSANREGLSWIASISTNRDETKRKWVQAFYHELDRKMAKKLFKMFDVARHFEPLSDTVQSLHPLLILCYDRVKGSLSTFAEALVSLSKDQQAWLVCIWEYVHGASLFSILLVYSPRLAAGAFPFISEDGRKLYKEQALLTIKNELRQDQSLEGKQKIDGLLRIIGNDIKHPTVQTLLSNYQKKCEALPVEF